MKKIISVILVFVLAISLFSCGSVASSNNDKLVVATNAEFLPYEYKEGQEFKGIDIEIIQEISKALGKEYEILDIAFDSVLPAVSTNKADIAASGITVTEDRKKNVDFSIPYVESFQKIIVLDDSPIKTIEDLKGKKIGVQQGTTGDMYCTDDFGDSSMERYSKISDGIPPLKNGKVDCLVIDDQVAINICQSNSGIKTLDSQYAKEEYAFAVKKGNTELLNKINEVITELKNSGKLAQIMDKYSEE